MTDGLRILILDPVPVYAEGMAAALRVAGFDPEVCLDRTPAGTWPPPETYEGAVSPEREAAEPVYVLSLRTDADWPALRALTDRPRCVVAVLPDPEPAHYRRALRAGARSAVAQDARTAEIVGVVAAAANGRTSLPCEVARALAGSGPDEPDAVARAVDGAEAHWLRSLASGVTVARLAAQACYSEREMYRLLGDLYSRIGARNRSEAIVAATKAGIIR
jgi:DNA-binding NarL/FixJ family response regulator